MQVVATGAALLISMQLLSKTLPQAVKNTSRKYETRAWLSSTLSMLFVGGMYVINSRTDIIMLGTMTGAEAAGIYNAATRGAELITFILMPLHQALGPAMASLYASNNVDQLQHIVQKAPVWSFCFPSPLQLAC